MRPACLIILLFLIAASTAVAQVEELFSRHIRIVKPQGEFAPKLAKLSPGGGEGWQTVEDAAHTLRLAVPVGAQVDTRPSGSRILQVVLTDAKSRPRPVLRVDQFTPAQGDPTVVDLEYAQEFADSYPEEAFGGKFSVNDSGLVTMKKQNFAMVGGTYTQGGAGAYRVQWATLSPERQLFVTFDCADAEWELHADTVARVLLSLNSLAGKKE